MDLFITPQLVVGAPTLIEILHPFCWVGSKVRFFFGMFLWAKVVFSKIFKDSRLESVLREWWAATFWPFPPFQQWNLSKNECISQWFPLHTEKKTIKKKPNKKKVTPPPTSPTSAPKKIHPNTCRWLLWAPNSRCLKKTEKKHGTLPRHLNSHMPPCTRMSSGVFSPPHSTRHTPSNKQAWRWLRNFITPVVTNLGSRLSRSWGVPRLPDTLVGGIWPPKTYLKHRTSGGIWKTRVLKKRFFFPVKTHGLFPFPVLVTTK